MHNTSEFPVCLHTRSLSVNFSAAGYVMYCSEMINEGVWLISRPLRVLEMRWIVMQLHFVQLSDQRAVTSMTVVSSRHRARGGTHKAEGVWPGRRVHAHHCAMCLCMCMCCRTGRQRVMTGTVLSVTYQETCWSATAASVSITSAVSLTNSGPETPHLTGSAMSAGYTHTYLYTESRKSLKTSTGEIWNVWCKKKPLACFCLFLSLVNHWTLHTRFSGFCTGVSHRAVKGGTLLNRKWPHIWGSF